jgi:hypothetical protein
MISLAEFNAGVWLEGAMFVCFGVSWPVAILKTLRAKRVEGKSVGFLTLIFLGYLAGVGSKFARAAETGRGLEWTVALLALNGLFVGVEIFLYFRYRKRMPTPPPGAP